MKLRYFICITCSTMSSPDEPKPNMFLPSMLRNNGGKFGETLGKALLNKFQSPRKSQPEGVENAEDPVDKKEEEVKPSTTVQSTTSPEGIGALDRSSTMDRMPRNEILSDVRAKRVRPPSTRPRSNVLKTEDLVAAEIPLDENISPPSSPEEEKKKVPISQNAFIMKSVAVEVMRKQESAKTTANNTPNNTTEVEVEKKTSLKQSLYKKEASTTRSESESELMKRKFPLKNRSERPVSVGNFETFNKTLPDSEKNAKTTEEMDKTQEESPRRYGKRGLYHSKSTDVLNIVSSTPPSTTPTNDKNDKQLIAKQEEKNKSLRSLKTSAVTLVKSVQTMEVEVALMKKQLANLFAIIKEIEENDKK